MGRIRNGGRRGVVRGELVRVSCLFFGERVLLVPSFWLDGELGGVLGWRGTSSKYIV